MFDSVEINNSNYVHYDYYLSSQNFVGKLNLDCFLKNDWCLITMLIFSAAILSMIFHAVRWVIITQKWRDSFFYLNTLLDHLTFIFNNPFSQFLQRLFEKKMYCDKYRNCNIVHKDQLNDSKCLSQNIIGQI
jgi:hypothetical protein